jgi:hypothetical protein
VTLGTTVASLFSAARAAASSSTVSDLPRRRRIWRFVRFNFELFRDFARRGELGRAEVLAPVIDHRGDVDVY